jgi:hypothetical protein
MMGIAQCLILYPHAGMDDSGCIRRWDWGQLGVLLYLVEMVDETCRCEVDCYTTLRTLSVYAVHSSAFLQ